MSDVGGVGDSKDSGSVGQADGPSSTGDDKDVSEAEVNEVAKDALDTGDDVAASVGASIEAEDPLDTVETDGEVIDPDATETPHACSAPEHELDPASKDLTAVESGAPVAGAEVEAPQPLGRDQEFVDELYGHMKETRGEYATCEKAELLHDVVHANPETAPAVEARVKELSMQGEVDGMVLSATLMHAQGSPNMTRAEKMEQAQRAVPFTMPSSAGSEFAAAIISNGQRGKLPNMTAGPQAPRTSTAKPPSPRLGDLRPEEMAKIQAAADKLGTDIFVVGSAAKGSRRNVGTDLPLADFGAPKAGTRSDIDYAVKNGFDDAATKLDLPDLDSSWGVRGVDYIDLDSSPAIRFSPGRSPTLLDGGGRIKFD